MLPALSPTPPRNQQGSQAAREKGALRSVRARARRLRLRAVIQMLDQIKRMKKEGTR